MGLLQVTELLSLFAPEGLKGCDLSQKLQNPLTIQNMYMHTYVYTPPPHSALEADHETGEDLFYLLRGHHGAGMVLSEYP